MIPTAFVRSLHLTHFRCYDAASLEGLETGLIVLTGPNGAGKTNVLEAVSLLTPGRGLRGARNEDLQQQGSVAPWAVVADVGEARIGTGGNADNPTRRRTRIDGAKTKTQAALAAHMACLWLTPQMDRLFLEGAAARRRFLDRLIFALDPAHAVRVTRYDRAMTSRARLLREGGGGSHPSWLEALEAEMATAGVAVEAARLDGVERLKAYLSSSGDFPCAHLSYAGAQELEAGLPALAVEAQRRAALARNRTLDAARGRCTLGPHRGDLVVQDMRTGRLAALGSSGEQKALLIGIILAHARLIIAARGMSPVLLLDEVAAHLDPDRRVALFSQLLALGGQVWMTGTESSLFDSLCKQIQHFCVDAGRIF